MLYMFRLKRFKQTTKIDTIRGKTIGFIDNEPPRTTDQILELMHIAYGQGILDGREEKSKDIRKILKIL